MLKRLFRRKEKTENRAVTGGSLTRRMITVATVGILILLGVGGYALDRVSPWA